MAAVTDPQTLRAFVTVAHEGNVSRAATRLHLSQPAVSLQLKSLAQASGLDLFARAPHGLVLTRDGAALLPQAEKALAALADFNQAVKSLHNTVRGRLRIGTILDPEFTRLGAFLKELVESAPQIETDLRQGMSGEVLQRIVADELDVGFYLGLPEDSGGVAPVAGQAPEQNALDSRMLSRFVYRVVAPAGWGEQVQGRDWKALAALPWIATPSESAHHRLLSSVFTPLGVQPRQVARVDQEASMIDLVRSGVGLSLIRESIAIAEAQARGLVIADRVSLPCQLSFISLRSRRSDPVVASAWEALKQVWR